MECVQEPIVPPRRADWQDAERFVWVRWIELLQVRFEGVGLYLTVWLEEDVLVVFCFVLFVKMVDEAPPLQDVTLHQLVELDGQEVGRVIAYR